MRTAGRTGAGARPAIMSDVARRAGVSIQTVSRVLNASPAVSEGTRQRVVEAIRELGYKPNVIARALVRGRSPTIGVVLVDTRHHGPITTLMALERAARRAGFGLTVVSPEGVGDDDAVAGGAAGADFAGAYRTLLAQSVAGVVLIASQDVGGAVAPPPGLPAVAIEAGSVPGVPTMGLDQNHGARVAVEHLVALGHRRVDHVAGPVDWPQARARLAGWREATAAAGLVAPAPAPGSWTPTAGYRWALAHAADPDVTAVVAANDQLAFGILRACWETGVRVPEQLSVVGFDDSPEAAWSVPALTSVRQDFDALGGAALELLLPSLRDGAPAQRSPAGAAGGRATPTDPPVVPLPDLVVRESTGPPPAR